MKEIADRLERIRGSIGEAIYAAGRCDEVTLVAVSKTVAAEAIVEVHAAGQRVFGENRVNEALEKQDVLARRGVDVDWHMIGHVQSNKAKPVATRFQLVQSVDSSRLARILDRYAAEASRVLPVLYEINVASESSKTGFLPEEFDECLPELLSLEHLKPCGLMTIAPHVADPRDAAPAFRGLREMRDRIRDQHDLKCFRELSMGMSNDYLEAIRHGATIVRLGRAIFGERTVA